MIHMPEVDLGVTTSLVGGIQEVGNERKWVSILLRDLVKTAKIYAEPEGTVFLFYEQDQSSVR